MSPPIRSYIAAVDTIPAAATIVTPLRWGGLELHEERENGGSAAGQRSRLMPGGVRR